MPASLRAYAAIALLVATFASGYRVADWRLTAEANDAALERAERDAKALAALAAERDAMADDLAAANDRHIANLRTARDETNRLRDRLRAGSIGLRIAGTCPHLPSPQGTPGARVDTGTGTELAEPARQAYFALRDGIDQAGAQLAACQDELRRRQDIGRF